ncbi:MAG: hypothetical protein FWE62_04465, partial [Firmicutes bacterium]|nr:hypothetical protein [Bacillota bacterium]
CRAFFDYADQHAKNVETIQNELNFIFTGCYTSQSRIKQANRCGERLFKETEKLAAFTDNLGLTQTDKIALDSAWRKHLFNHFHDILPGSCVTATREYAGGQAQERNAALGVIKSRALSVLGANLAQTAAPNDDRWSTAEGAGVGFSAHHGVHLWQAGGKNSRAYLLYNHTAVPKEFVTEIPIWDFDCPTERLAARDFDGNALPLDCTDWIPIDYWGHKMRRAYVKCAIPANGYRAVIVTDGGTNCRSPYLDYSWQQQVEDNYILENELVRAEFDRHTAALVLFADKRTGYTLGGTDNPVGAFKYAVEDAGKGMTAWICGHYEKTEYLLNAKISHGEYRNDLMARRFKYAQTFGASALNVTVTLSDGCDFLDYQVDAGFREIGNNQTTPSLLFALKTEETARYIYDVPYGVIERKAEDDDRPALSFVCAAAGRGATILSTDSKYGFRCYAGETAVNLMRASTEPDKTPEVCDHSFHICVGAHTHTTAKELLEKTETYYKPVDVVSVAPGAGGRLPHTASMFTHTGGAVLSAVKSAEDAGGMIFRFYEADGKACKNTLELTGRKIVKAYWCDGCENNLSELRVKNGKAVFEIPAYGISTIRVLTE